MAIFFTLLQSRSTELFTDTQLFDDSTIALDVLSLEVIKHAATLTYQRVQGALGTEVLTVLLQVLGEVLDTEGEECNLALCRTGVLGVLPYKSNEGFASAAARY